MRHYHFCTRYSQIEKELACQSVSKIKLVEHNRRSYLYRMAENYIITCWESYQRKVFICALKEEPEYVEAAFDGAMNAQTRHLVRKSNRSVHWKISNFPS